MLGSKEGKQEGYGTSLSGESAAVSVARAESCSSLKNLPVYSQDLIKRKITSREASLPVCGMTTGARSYRVSGHENAHSGSRNRCSCLRFPETACSDWADHGLDHGPQQYTNSRSQRRHHERRNRHKTRSVVE